MYKDNLSYLSKRLTYLIIAIEVLFEDRPDFMGAEPLSPQRLKHYRTLFSAMTTSGVFSTGDGKLLEEILRLWQGQPIAIREIVHTLASDIEWLVARPAALSEIAVRQRRWRGETPS